MAVELSAGHVAKGRQVRTLNFAVRPAAGTPAEFSFDLGRPPLDPPAGCVDEVMWRRAHALFSEHPAGPGCCSRCGGTYPCLANRLARAGLRTAVGEVNADSVYWTVYARLLAQPTPRSQGGRS